ncbi:519_t:CDS:2 [Cetraspora pellucida]|uniref:519_t:CDS:1 n=1 Tax=Cetraspora pellucida TaxID=1433469 RepID=A0ACA9LKZ4_9GLOM|nr:519_t:CDS:2 [Cetraspora pellucida]
MQKEIAELSCKRSLYTEMSRTTTWRKKQKADTSLNMKASSDLLHLFLAVYMMKWLQLSQSPSSTLLANALLLVSLSYSSKLSIEITKLTSFQTATHNLLPTNKEKLEMHLNEVNQKYGQEKMNASIYFIQTIWYKGNNMTKHIRK